MPHTLPTLCGSMAAHPYRLAVELHNAAYRELGVDYTFVYFGIEDPEAGVSAIRSLGIRGMNVSMPFKSEVLPFLDVVDPAAEAIGAVNTIDNREGVLTGYNTDYLGAMRALKETTELHGARVALLGAGGAARAVAYGLKKEGALVTVYNRSMDKAGELADSFELERGGALEDYPGSNHYDILVNCTSVGFNAAKESPLGRDQINPELVVMDVVFLPLETRLLGYAREKGCQTISGVRMLLHQACGQVELYTGHQAPIEVMEEVIERELQLMGK